MKYAIQKKRVDDPTGRDAVLLQGVFSTLGGVQSAIADLDKSYPNYYGGIRCRLRVVEINDSFEEWRD